MTPPAPVAGLLIDVNLAAGLVAFTAEVVFKPASHGPQEQRFFHLQVGSCTASGALPVMRRVCFWCVSVCVSYEHVHLLCVQLSMVVVVTAAGVVAR